MKQMDKRYDLSFFFQGEYFVNLPDGRLQKVTYTVVGDAGYVADVVYTGEAQYPPEPAGGYVGRRR